MSCPTSQLRATWPTTLFSSALFCAVAYLLFWNERQSILSGRSLDEAEGLVETIDPRAPDAARRHDGGLVHLCGPIKVLEPLSEPDYNIQVLSVKLKKRVEMYQWIEEATEGATGESYYYSTDWRDRPVDSNLFYISPGHHNPKDMPLSGQTHVAENVNVGEIALGLDLKKKVSDYYDFTSDERPERHDIKLHSGAYYHAADPLVHEVGDLRVSFSYAGRNNDEYCALGELRDGAVRPFVSAASPEPLALLRKGRHSSAEMLALEFRDSRAIAWRFRIVGWFQTFAAAMSLHPDWFALLADSRWASPRVRRRGRLFVNLTLATCATLLIVAVARCAYSPLLSLALVGTAVLPVVYFSGATKYAPLPDNEHHQ